MYFEVALLAYLIDFFFSEFNKIKSFKHPIIFIGNLISFFEKHFYKDSILRGGVLTSFVIVIVFSISYTLSLVDSLIFQSFLASLTISSKMLYDSVYDVLTAKDSKRAISMLVSRDTKDMSDSDVNKASIETYAENLSDGVIAPLFYLLIFGLPGAYVYKAINTLDSMVGYRNEKYENFGKISAVLDDIVNYIPARITAILISIFFLSKKALLNFNTYGKKHESLNAGLPIAAMAFSLEIKLGGPTSYFNKIKQKPFFGIGEECITKKHVEKALSIKTKLDIFIIIFLTASIFFANL